LPSYRDKKIHGYAPKTAKDFCTKTKKQWDKNKWDTLQIHGGTGDLTWDTTATTAGLWTVNTSAATSTTDVQLTGNWGSSITSTGDGTTLDALWGVGSTQQFLVDQMSPPKSPTQGPPKTLMDELTQEIDKEIVADLIKKAGGNTDKVPKDKIPPSMMFQAPPLTPAKDSFSPAKKPLKPYVLNPETMQLVDAHTGESVEDQLDAKTLAVFKGQQEPTEEGFGLGQYPGPPVISAKKLKKLADMEPDEPGIPQVDLSIVIEPAPPGEQFGAVLKQTTLTTPDGKKKIIKTPITG
jgi:hypothetical protein